MDFTPLFTQLLTNFWYLIPLAILVAILKSTVVMREAQKGSNKGNKFWGCSKFPQCRGVISIT